VPVEWEDKVREEKPDYKRADKWAFLLIAIFVATMIVLALTLPLTGGVFTYHG
jgi:hypothetical protein